MDHGTSAALSSLERTPSAFADQPFYDQTVTLLDSVRDHDFATLAALCDDDFGIVDIDVAGNARPIRDRAEWEEWFTTLFATLTSMNAATDSVILDYRAMRQDALGFGVLEFQQNLTVGVHVARFQCVATIIWKLTPDGWREARWHASIISSDIPTALLRAA
jgi:hypothetical protein